MPEHRRKFSPQFRAEAVQMVIEAAKPIAEVDPLRALGEAGRDTPNRNFSKSVDDTVLIASPQVTSHDQISAQDNAR